jgi:uncharacterized protein YbjQ (UPF0145 family)
MRSALFADAAIAREPSGLVRLACLMLVLSWLGILAYPDMLDVARPPTGSAASRECQSMMVSNLEIVPGRRVVKHLGLVQGSTVRAKHVGKDLLAGLKNIVGGELKGYTELLLEARKEATERMMEQAEAVGANAVLNVRFSTSSITQGAAELLAYGTAVVLE